MTTPMSVGMQAAKVADPAATQRLVQLARQRRAAHRPLTEAEQSALAQHESCMHCGGFHSFACRRVKSIAFQSPPGRGLASVEYWPWADVDWTGVIWDDGNETEDDGSVAITIPADLVKRLRDSPAAIKNAATRTLFKLALEAVQSEDE